MYFCTTTVRWDLQLPKMSGCKPGLDKNLISELSHRHTHAHKNVNQNLYYSAQKKKIKYSTVPMQLYVKILVLSVYIYAYVVMHSVMVKKCMLITLAFRFSANVHYNFHLQIGLYC